MKVSDALQSRITCRAFLPDPVPAATVRAILDGAKQAPSGGNLQPWWVWVLAGEPLQVYLKGKVLDVMRKTAEGFTRGYLHLVDADPMSARWAMLEFQNEYLSVKVDGSVIEVVPNLISVLETESGRAVGTEELKYGLLVSVISIPCTPLLATPEALEVVGPQAFGMEERFVQRSEYIEPASVF